MFSLRASFLFVLLVGLLMAGCGSGAGVTVNGKVISDRELKNCVGDVKDVVLADPGSLEKVEAKTEIGKVMKEMMVLSAKIDQEHEKRLAGVSFDDVLTVKPFQSKTALNKAIHEMDEIADIETEFVRKKVALSEKYEKAIDSSSFQNGILKSRGKLKTLLEKELAFADATRKYLRFGLKFRPTVSKGNIFWPSQVAAQAISLEKDAAEKLNAMVRYADDMEIALEESKASFLEEANNLPQP